LAGASIEALKREKLVRLRDFLQAENLNGRLKRAGFSDSEAQAILSKLASEIGSKTPINFSLSRESSTVFCLKISSSVSRIFFVADLEADRLLSAPSRCKQIRFESEKEQVQLVSIHEELYGLDEQFTISLK
jgi:hypothetical protein